MGIESMPHPIVNEAVDEENAPANQSKHLAKNEWKLYNIISINLLRFHCDSHTEEICTIFVLFLVYLFFLEKAYPEYIELLAQITSIQTSPSLNGCCITGQGLSQSPEQLMEAILEGLGAMKGLGGSLGQPFINYQEEVMSLFYC